jgi:hypothetical protein
MVRKLNMPTKRPPDPIELRIYPVADGGFDVYQDGGDGHQFLEDEGVHMQCLTVTNLPRSRGMLAIA